MNKLLKVMDDIVIAILGKSVVEKRSGEDRRKKKQEKVLKMNLFRHLPSK